MENLNDPTKRILEKHSRPMSSLWDVPKYDNIEKPSSNGPIPVRQKHSDSRTPRS